MHLGTSSAGPYPQGRALSQEGVLNLTLVDHGRRQDVTSAHDRLLHIKDGDDRAGVCHLQVHLKEVPQVGDVLQPSVYVGHAANIQNRMPGWR